jgi:hypothetical protein
MPRPSGEPLITDEQFEKLLANYPPNWTEEHTELMSGSAADFDDLKVIGVDPFDLFKATADPVPVVKLFLPHVRWLLCWIYPHDHDLAFAAIKFGAKPSSINQVRLSDIVRSRLGTLTPERDKYITLDQPISHYLYDDNNW